MMRGGRSLVSSAPAFSNDGKKMLVCTGNTVSIFSTSTGLQVAELERHTGFVTSVIVVPAPKVAITILCYCWTSSLDGTIRYWDFSTLELVKTIDIKYPIHSMVIPGLSVDSLEADVDLFAYLTTEEDKSQPQKKKQPNSTLGGRVQKCNLTKSRLAGGQTLAETKKPEKLIMSSCGKYLGISDKRKIRVWEVPRKDSDRAVHKKMRFHHTKDFTTLAFHPTEQILAAGDVTGRILLWRGFGSKNLGDNVDDENDDLCTTWHWHSSQVTILFFSSDGAYMYSGGREAVLVVWQLDTGKKKFLPRIGAPLLYFLSSPDPSFSSMSCADNRIHLLKMPSMEILKSISGIKLPAPVPEMYENSCKGVAFDHNDGIVAIRTENYCIQFWSLLDDREISEVQVCQRSHQPGDEVTVVVSFVSLSLDNSSMITVENRVAEEGIGGLVSLKFWTCGSHTKDFTLSTVVYEPHRDAGVSGIAFHPTRRMAVSSSYGGDFKIWVCNHEKDQTVQNPGWTCHAVGSYKKKPMTAAAFSWDGSVLAVAAETVITLWDPEKNVLIAVLRETLEKIVNLSFIGKSEYLVSASRGANPQLSVWNMSKLSASWSYKLQIEDVASTIADDLFAVLALVPKSSRSEDGIILLFNIEDPTPVASWLVHKAIGGALSFINQRSGVDRKLLVAFINCNHEYTLFHPRGEQAGESKVSLQENLMEIEEEKAGLRSGYASIYGDLQDFALKKDENLKSEPIVLSERPWETIFSGSSHNLPSLTKLSSVFLESLLEKRAITVE